MGAKKIRVISEKKNQIANQRGKNLKEMDAGCQLAVMLFN